MRSPMIRLMYFTSVRVVKDVTKSTPGTDELPLTEDGGESNFVPFPSS